MTVRALTSAELSQFESGLQTLVRAPRAAAMSVQGDVITGAKDEFCTIWEKASPILKIVAKYIVYIPGVGTTAGEILNALISVLDGLSEQVCPKS
jgi:hypothetical protein